MSKSYQWWLSLSLLSLLGLWTRFYKVSEPNWVCWDETHFGKMGSWYINRTFFFDVHPPLGKMIIGAVGYITGYNGTFPFEKPGDLYGDHNILGMRIACTFMGLCLIPFSFLTVWELTKSLQASIFAGALILCDIGMITLNQYILLDPILLFFISGGTYSIVKFRNQFESPFSISWWSWLFLTGVMIGGAISVKFVGLFVVLLVGLFTLVDLWNLLGDLSLSFSIIFQHFLSRVLCLILVPILLYVFLFYIHLSVLYKSGNGDGHFSSAFQSALIGNPLHEASLPRYLAFGAVITLKNYRTGGGYLHSHSHLYPEGLGARQQQITAYTHKDNNNKFLIKPWNQKAHKGNEEKENHENNESIVLVKNGDLIRLQHVVTGRNLHSHFEPAPMTKKMYQVTGYGENGTGDANDVWRVELNTGLSEDSEIQTVTSKIKLHHYFAKCVLSTTSKILPKWGYEQQEVVCNPMTRDPNSLWNIEDNYFPKLPNVSLSNFAPGFLSRFLESHAVMFQGNANLKPKEGEITSKPWEWPINLRGQFFSGNDMRIYLLGNPVIWWSNIVFLLFFLVHFLVSSFRAQRSQSLSTFPNDFLGSSLWLFLGWAIHYFPFWSMGRVLYFHHYFPSLLYSSMLSSVLLDYLLKWISKKSSILYQFLFGLLVSSLSVSFISFSPLVYGMNSTSGSLSNSSVHHLKWIDSWEF